MRKFATVFAAIAVCTIATAASAYTTTRHYYRGHPHSYPYSWRSASHWRHYKTMEEGRAMALQPWGIVIRRWGTGDPNDPDDHTPGSSGWILEDLDN